VMSAQGMSVQNHHDYAVLYCRYAEYDTIRPLFQKYLQYGDSILVLGPGASMLHDQMYDRWAKRLAFCNHAVPLSAVALQSLCINGVWLSCHIENSTSCSCCSGDQSAVSNMQSRWCAISTGAVKGCSDCFVTCQLHQPQALRHS